MKECVKDMVIDVEHFALAPLTVSDAYGDDNGHYQGIHQQCVGVKLPRA